MDNLATDTNVGTNFQPMPKRFMVWDKVGKRFLGRRLPDGVDTVFSIFELPLEIDCLDEEEKEQFTICQSTNLFDKDGEEIFEGSIVKYQPYGEQGEEKIGYIKFDLCLGQWELVNVKDEVDADAFGQMEGGLCRIGCKEVELIGHILSTPELLEEKDV